jgi:phosphatidylinositol glycan class B
MTVASPWQWFCSTRTFSNGIETTLTIAALYFWPWKLSSDTILSTGSDLSHSTGEDEDAPETAEPGVFGTAKSVRQ